MSTSETAPTPAADAVPETGSPDQYHLHGPGVRISYYPSGAGPLTVDGPIILSYEGKDATQALVFRGEQAQIVPVAGLGTCVTVTVQGPLDSGGTTVTLLIPTVVLAAGQPATVRTELITTVHNSVMSGVGDAQRDHYTVTGLIGEASQGAIPQ